MEQSNGLKRSETWNNIYEVLARLDLKETTGDCMDRPSAATEIEELFLKLLPIQLVSNNESEAVVAVCLHPYHHVEEMAVVVCTDCDEIMGRQTDC